MVPDIGESGSSRGHRMKQILNNLRTGQLQLQEVPVPLVKPGHVLIRTTCSLISPGTERMLIDFGRAGYLSKVRQQPEKLKQVLDKVQTDGLVPTMRSVFAKLDEPIPLGYCNAGRVLSVGPGVTRFRTGDRVVSNGSHAEVVLVPANLCARIPDPVSDEQASFTILSSIALHGIRLLGPQLGESVAVFGLGLIGLIAVQLLKANGTRVIGFDNDPSRVEIARGYGITAVDLSIGSDPVRAASVFTEGFGVDGVLITAATQSHELIREAAEMCRKRGRIILTGVVGLNLNRSDFYEKELTFQVSCSYGPGRYDPDYEVHGHDYPYGYVRWTEQRNFEAVLELIENGSVRVDELLSMRVPIDRAVEGYNAVSRRTVLSVLLEYPEVATESPTPLTSATVAIHRQGRPSLSKPVIGVIGSGNYTRIKLLPAIRKARASLKWIASAQGVSASTSASKFGFERSTTDYGEILADSEVNAVFITTRHNLHARMVSEALKAGKSVFVEKPLCLTESELDSITQAYADAQSSFSSPPILMVGYNRRFSPLVSIVRTKLSGRQAPLALAFTCNAGAVPANHWVHDPAEGGGRIIGEACHFIDLLHYLVGAPITRVAALDQSAANDTHPADTVSILLKFSDFSIGQINYFATGSKKFPKERLDIFSEGRVLQLDNFRKIQAFGFGTFKGKRLWVQDKGHEAGFLCFLDAVATGGESPIAFDSLLHTSRVTLAVMEALSRESLVDIRSTTGFL